MQACLRRLIGGVCDRFSNAILAQRLQREAGAAAEMQIRRAYELCYARDPADAELAVLAPFVEQQGTAELCRVLFNSNEFLYVD